MYDLVIRNGRVIDGAGNPWIRANIAIDGDRIVKVSRREMEAERSIDADGFVVAPGFIDCHTHSDSTVLENNVGVNYLTQGVTTVVTGECGGSQYPLDKEAQKQVEARLRTRARDPSKVVVDWLSLGDWRRKLEGTGIGVNHVPLVGHRTIRTQVLGNERARTLTMPEPGEIEAEKEILRGAMEDGAFGLSIGLSANNVYPEECIEVLSVVKEYGRSGVSGVCAHVYGRKYEGWGKPIEAMRQIQKARDRGVEVVADVYPWPFAACANALSLFVSGGAYDERVHGRLEEGLTVEGMVKDLRESTSWMGMKEELMDSWKAENDENERRRRLLWERSNIDAPRTRPFETTPVIAYSKTHPELVGLNFTEVAEAMGIDDWSAALRLAVIDDEGATYLGTTMSNEEDRRVVISQPWTMFESDSSMVDGCSPTPMLKPVHPRGSACTAMILGMHVREEGLLTLEEAVRKMTSLTAQFHDMGDRGLIREGMKADITIFDPETVKSNATYADPCNWASGVSTVIVNGVVEFEEGEHTGKLAGKVLRLER
jgi:N-acyl-D-aspartate/D-glutamate deacylase